uniref:Rab-GAP TBC domain-containing protein n=1 Tax=Meloidogyne javanica TaxID=6303 RepID=A0A915MRZ4_MELJA
MSSKRFNDFLRRAQGAISNFRNDDELLGVTLVLQWMPNTLLEKNPTSIRSVSPKPLSLNENVENKNLIITRLSCSNREVSGDSEEEGEFLSLPSIKLIPNTPIEQEMDGKIGDDRLTESSGATSCEDELVEDEEEEGEVDNGSSVDDKSEEDEKDQNSSRHSVSFCQKFAASLFFDSIPEHFARDHNLVWNKINNDENGEEEESTSNILALTRDKVIFQSKKAEEEKIILNEDQNNNKEITGKKLASLFSVNLGKMRSMRVFYSNPERTSGQLVIASYDSQYKIFHFHHDGLDKLALIFERWNAVKAKSAGNDSPSVAGPDRHLLICPVGADLAKTEMDPEDGLYERLNWDHWRSFISKEGNVGDSFTVRKIIYFASMDPKMRKELWPFLLRIFPWSSTYEHRESIRNDLFLRYQRMKRNRIKKISKATEAGEKFYANVESSILKDVLRTDRRNSFFAGDGNANLETMKSILLTYAVRFPEINYIQGMSDLLAPLLFTLRDEPLAYWCFTELMKQTLFCQSEQRKSVMEIQLDYLRELIRLFVPE